MLLEDNCALAVLALITNGLGGPGTVPKPTTDRRNPPGYLLNEPRSRVCSLDTQTHRLKHNPLPRNSLDLAPSTGVPSVLRNFFVVAASELTHSMNCAAPSCQSLLAISSDRALGDGREVGRPSRQGCSSVMLVCTTVLNGYLDGDFDGYGGASNAPMRDRTAALQRASSPRRATAGSALDTLYFILGSLRCPLRTTTRAGRDPLWCMPHDLGPPRDAWLATLHRDCPDYHMYL
ncbi:hypothetical protein LshimejAT787_1001720 [Lyophyllum shimeji]|uniref:Uncharacterized protein n=1 Tax=Lyophyllum shimeji TaxID=47721 RepID=A0A9P3PRT8_LYOSH|nr:hypothetical protein LshimejAT787_1001720 [Lyophyllum shimeji]